MSTSLLHHAFGLNDFYYARQRFVDGALFLPLITSLR